MIRFYGQVAIVTGAGRGMRREIALLLARRGAYLLIRRVWAHTRRQNDGYFDRELTPKKVREHMNEIRDLGSAAYVGSSMEENMRYAHWLPWTGGRAGTF